MLVPHFAKRTLTALALATAMAGCGKDSTSPDSPFDPEGTSSDIGAMGAAFDSPAMAGFVAASGSIGTVLELSLAAAAVRAAPTKALVTGGKPAAKRYAGALAKSFGPGAPAASAVIPEQYLGITFVYDEELDQYVASERTGAPADGVRFAVYSVNPISGAIVEPAVEVGYADIATTETANSATVRVELVSDDVTYLDYAVSMVAGTSANLTITGFISNGDDRVNFDLDNIFSASGAEIDYTLTVPTRGNFRIDLNAEGSGSVVQSLVRVSGPHGTVVVEGSQNSTSGSFDVEVNGDPFATVSFTVGEDPVITGADGEALTPQELAAMQAVFAVVLGGFDFFEDLLDPLS